MRWDEGAATTTLVGRDRETATIDEIVTAAGRGTGRVLLLEGEPGIGKTRLVEHACDRARDSDLEVFLGRCDDLAAGRPFAPLLDALGITPASSDPGRIEIAALLATPSTGLLSGTSNPGSQFRVVDAIGALIEQSASQGPILLALEDLHWADTPTLVAVRSIARRVQTLPVVLLGSLRAGHAVAELHRVSDDLLRAGGIRVAVGPLDDPSVESLATEVLAARPSDDLLARLRGAAGNPLFVCEYVRSAFAERADGPGDAPTPVEFRHTVLRRLTALPDATNDVLRLASVLGSTFSPGDLAVVAGRSLVDLTPALHQAVVAAVIEERGEQLAFRHALVRDAVYEHIPGPVRRELHREAGRALADAGADVLAVARQVGLGAVAGDPDAVTWLRRAARDAASRAPAVAAELLAQARDLLAPTSPDRVPLLAELAVAMAWSGRLAEAEALAVEVLARSPDPAVTGPLRCGLVYALTWQGRAADALRYATPGPDEHLDEGDAALLAAQSAVAHLFAFDLRSAGSLAAEATEAAERLDHELALCHALTVRAWLATFAGRTQEAVELAYRAVDLADRTTTGEANLAHPRFFPGLPLMAVDRLDEAEEVLTTGLRVAESLGLAWSLPLYHAHLGTRRFIAGEWDAAIAEFEASLAAADEVGLHIGVIASTAAWLAAIQLHRDELEAAEQTLATAMARMAETGPQLGMGIFNWARGLVLEARGEPAAALAPLQAGWDLFMVGGPVTDSWSAMALLRLSLATGDRERASAMLPVIDDQAAATGTPFMRAQALRCRGLVEHDPDLLLEAVAMYRQCPRPLERAEGCEDAGILLASADRLQEAVPLWDEALELYDQLSAHRDINRVRALLRQHGVKRGTRRQHVRATSGWDSLTDSERRVVALVAQRLSNPEVAERLFISRHTVESHLKQIYRKLGVSSRQELAVLAAQQDEHGNGTARPRRLLA